MVSVFIENNYYSQVATSTVLHQGWLLPYLGMDGRSCGDDPRFVDF